MDQLAGKNSRLDNLRNKPKDDKTAIAGGIAIFVVAILIIAWGILFLKKIAREHPPETLETQEFDYTSLRDTTDASGRYDSSYNPPADFFTGSDNAVDPFGETR